MRNEKIDYAARFLIRSCQKAFLATELSKKSLDKKTFTSKNSIPYSTFVMTASDYDGSPLILLSNLSEHTKNLKTNNLASLLFYEEQKEIDLFPEFDNSDLPYDYEDPMSRPRLTVIGELKISKEAHHKKRFSLRHPTSNFYINFKDMNIYKLHVKLAHITAGFAKVKWFFTNEILYDVKVSLKNDEFSIIKHMNDHHQESINLYEKNLFTQSSIKGNWKLIGIDPEGFDMRLKENVKRYNFENPIKKIEILRSVFIKLHNLAKKS